MTDEAMVEAVARALCKADGWTSRDVAHAWKAYRSLARAAIRALAPLIIERCAETAALDVDWAAFGKRDIEQWDGGPDAVRDYRLGIAAGRSISTAIRALIPAKGVDHE